MEKGRVKISLGEIQGIETEKNVIFKGVPYAKAPVGDLRFRPPVPVDAWEGVLKADKFSAKCYQMNQSAGFYGKEFYSNPDFMPPMSEDCLYLNIWTPKDYADTDSHRPYPVAFWIHGGGFNAGFGSELEFDGDAYTDRGVILVTINYRLSAFGFLALPELLEESGTTGNYGILDQIEALRFVHEHIAVFGGDPDNITIYGQSAGAMSTQTIINSPLSRGLFARAILQSGGGVDNGLAKEHTLESAYEIGHAFMKACRAKTLDDLRKCPPELFVKKLLPLMIKAKGLPFYPVVDGYVLEDTCDNNIRNNLIPDLPYMLGSCANDIDVKKKQTGRESGSGVYTGCIRWAETREKLSDKPTYLYYFSRQLPGKSGGAFHSSELWYMFGTIDRCWRPLLDLDRALSERMLDCWTSFMKNGNPKTKTDEWPAYTSDRPYIKEFGDAAPSDEGDGLKANSQLMMGNALQKTQLTSTGR